MFKQSILAMALVIGIGYGCTQKTEEIKPAMLMLRRKKETFGFL